MDTGSKLWRKTSTQTHASDCEPLASAPNTQARGKVESPSARGPHPRGAPSISVLADVSDSLPESAGPGEYQEFKGAAGTHRPAL